MVIPKKFNKNQPIMKLNKSFILIPVIRYAVQKTSIFLIKVFDIPGSEVETLVDQEKPAGSYIITWNAVDIPSGVYFNQLRTGGFVQTKKMILLKYD